MWRVLSIIVFEQTTILGERNVHLDLNPWWWLESSKDILSGVDTLKYDDPQVTGESNGEQYDHNQYFILWYDKNISSHIKL